MFPTGGNVATGSGNPGGSLIVGTPGTAGSYGILYSDSNATGGGGANSQYGAGGVALTINTGTGTSGGANAKGYGAGGGGAVSVHASNAASSPGGNGSPGIVIIWEYA